MNLGAGRDDEPWLNLVLGADRQALTNASCPSVAKLTDKIDLWVENWNHEPFIWNFTAEESSTKSPSERQPRLHTPFCDRPLGAQATVLAPDRTSRKMCERAQAGPPGLLKDQREFFCSEPPECRADQALVQNLP